MLRRKNKDRMNITALVDVIITALQMKNVEYTINYDDKFMIIEWKNHTAKVKGEYLWFDNKIQRSVYNVIDCIKAEN
jgi:hypothetical protein